MNYRLLQATEFHRLKPFCERNGVSFPDPERTYVAIAEQDGEIRYTHMLGLQFHLDNCVRDKDWRGYFDFRKVYNCLESAIPKDSGIILYTYPSFDGGVRAAQILGFEKAKNPLMMKRIGKESKCQ
jgi:hypothetical protein